MHGIASRRRHMLLTPNADSVDPVYGPVSDGIASTLTAVNVHVVQAFPF